MGIEKWNGKEILFKVDDLTAKKLIKVGFAVERSSKQLITALEAVDTGRLRASISTSWTGGPTGKVSGKARASDGIKPPTKKLTVVVGTNVEYAPHIELGTGKRAARPFLRPALAGTLAFLQSEFNKSEKL